jgi:hypothetical protein
MSTLKTDKAVAKYLRTLLSQGLFPANALAQVRVGCVQRGTPETVAKVDALALGLAKTENLTKGEQYLWQWIYSIESRPTTRAK